MTNDKRDANGKFAVGNAGGPGRPPRQTERDYLRIAALACSLDDWQGICQRAVDDALKGDAIARKFLAEYLMPKGLTLHDMAAAELAGVDSVRDRASELKFIALLNAASWPD